MEIFVRPDGTVKHISVDEFSTNFLGTATRRRASNVEPIHRGLRAIFYIIRSITSDNGWIAAWTRKWPCQWQANLYLSGGPVLGPFRNREDAIWAEIRWLNSCYERGQL